MSDAWVAALTPGTWERANRELTAKILTELTFEDVLIPEPTGEPDHYRTELPGAGAFTYRARRRLLGHHRVDPDTLRWHPTGEPDGPSGACRGNGDGTAGNGTDDGALPDVTDLVARAGPHLGLTPSTTAGAITELAGTLLSDAWQLARGRSADELADADPSVLEGEMRGHPWIVANKGRLGFGADDLAAYGPEAGRPVQLPWLAADPELADARSIDGLDHTDVVRDQVGDAVWHALRARAAAAGLDPDTAVYLPVHPWQWQNRVVPLHAGDLARRRLVPLGVQPARYLPQQSLRTLVDRDHPHRRYLKLPLSILNTSVYRGLPRDRTLAAPALTQWFTRLTAADPFLAETGLILLGEQASVSVAHPAFGAVPDVPYQHTEMLGAIWREPVADRLRPGERAVTLAALLHRDPAGEPFLGPVIRRSGVTVDDWVTRLHRALLPPLVHVLYRLGATFSPHAQNCLVVLKADVPTRAVVKDFVDDVMISAEPLPELADLPEQVRRCLGHGLEAPLLVQWIQGGLLVCVYRYLSELLEDHFGYPETAFWDAAARTFRGYQERFEDELADRFALFDLEAPMFVKLCLNRVRLFERGYADAPDRPVAAASGWIDNPLAPTAPAEHR